MENKLNIEAMINCQAQELCGIAYTTRRRYKYKLETCNRFTKANALEILEYLPQAFHKYLLIASTIYKGRDYITIAFCEVDFHPIHKAFELAKAEVKRDNFIKKAEEMQAQVRNMVINKGLAEVNTIDAF